MSPNYRRRKESVHLWLAIAVTLLLAAYRFCVELIDTLREFFEPYTSLPIADALKNGLFFMLMVLLWLAYRRWLESLEHQRELEVVISSIGPDVLMVVSPDRKITMCNMGVKAMYGFEPQEVVGGATDLLYYDRRLSGQPGEIAASLARFGFHVGFAMGRRKNGQEFPLEIVTGDLKGGPGAVVMLRDITERKRTEQQLVEAKEEAEGANRAKSQALSRLEESYQALKDLQAVRDRLIHMIVHDLKSPLSTIGGYLSMLESVAGPGLADDEASYLKEASRLTRVLQEMILSVLDVNRFENGQMPLSMEDNDVVALAREAAERSNPGGEKGAIVLVPPPGPLLVHCDKDVVTRIMVNLLDNALKFSPVGEQVTIAVAPVAGGVRVSVADRGGGVPKELHAKIFEQFAQVDARKYSTGLGLTFCKLAVEAHGGSIGVESEVEQGSTFWFELPVDSKG